MRRLITMLGGLLLILATPAVALAGGWVVVTLDGLPQQVRAGEEFAVGFMVRQHGREPLRGGDGTLVFQHDATGERVSIQAAEAGQPGHYAARVTLPRAGAWSWQVEFWQTHQMPPLTVQATAPVTAAPAPLAARPLLAGAGALVALALACLGLGWRLRAPAGRGAAA